MEQLRELLVGRGSSTADPSLRAAAARLGEALVDLETSHEAERSASLDPYAALAPAEAGALSSGEFSSGELEALIDGLPCIVYRCSADANWTMQYLNRRTRHIIGYEASALIGNRIQQFGQLIHPDDRAAVAGVIGNSLESGRSFHVSYRFLHRNGSYIWLWEHGRVVGADTIDGFIIDITETKRAEHESAETLARSRRQQDALTALVRSSAVADGKQGEAFEEIAVAALKAVDGVYRVTIWLCNRDVFELAFVTDADNDPAGQIENARIERSRSPEYFAALEREGVIAAADAHRDERTKTLPFGGGVPNSIGAVLDAAVLGGERLRGVLCLNRRESRPWRPEEVRFAEELAGQVGQVLLNAERQEFARRMAYQARHDALTGLVNRFEFEQQVKRSIQQVGSHGGMHVLLYLDLDHFKAVNDNCGHSAGDEILRQVSDLLKDTLRKSDTLARVGGDEFAALLEHTDLDEARAVARKLIEAVTEARFSWQGRQFRLGVSIGLSEISSSSTDFVTVLRAADTACYASKQAGRNQVQVYREDTGFGEDAAPEAQWLTRMHRLFETDRFALAYQRLEPLGEAAAPNRIEVLVRLAEGDGGLMQPQVFLPTAERYGFTERIDSWVFESVVAHLAELNEEQRPSVVSINLSAASIGSGSFALFVEQTAARADLPRGLIRFELSETAVAAQLSVSKRFITRMSEIGIESDLDGFGKDISSFAYLKALPVHGLKLDGAIVRGLSHDRVDRTVVEAIQRIADDLGLETVATAVEYRGILEHLSRIGITYAQGFALHRPETWPPAAPRAAPRTQ